MWNYFGQAFVAQAANADGGLINAAQLATGSIIVNLMMVYLLTEMFAKVNEYLSQMEDYQSLLDISDSKILALEQRVKTVEDADSTAVNILYQEKVD